MNLLNAILLQANAAENGAFMNIGFIILIILIFYFFMIRPQQKKQKEIRKAREAMKSGDKVVTAGGIYGRIKEVSDTWFMIEVSKGVNIKVDKGSIYACAEDAAADNATENK